MPVKRQFLFFVFVAAVLASYGLVRALRGKSGHASRLPAVTFYDKLDRTVTLEDFKGKVVLVNVWATWCTPCVAELPSLDRLQAMMPADRFRVVAISTDTTSRKTVMAFLRARKIRHLVFYWDKNRQIPLRWRYAGLPTSFLLDRKGDVLARFDGPYAWDKGKLLKEIKTLVYQ